MGFPRQRRLTTRENRDVICHFENLNYNIYSKPGFVHDYT